MAILSFGIDLAKKVFAVHGVNPAGKAEMVRPNVPHAKLHELIAALPACTIGMETRSEESQAWHTDRKPQHGNRLWTSGQFARALEPARSPTARHHGHQGLLENYSGLFRRKMQGVTALPTGFGLCKSP